MIQNTSIGKQVALVLILLSVIGMAGACKANETPAVAVEQYLHALAAQDQTGAVASSCRDWEEQAMAEGDSFINVQVSLNDLSCQVSSQSDSQATVTCTGKFVFSYDAGENQELDLQGRTFSVVKESGDWRMCGYE